VNNMQNVVNLTYTKEYNGKFKRGIMASVIGGINWSI